MREPPARQGIQTQTTTILTVNLLREKRTVITLSYEGIQRKWPQGAPQNILLKNIEKYFKLRHLFSVNWDFNNCKLNFEHLNETRTYTITGNHRIFPSSISLRFPPSAYSKI